MNELNKKMMKNEYTLKKDKNIQMSKEYQRLNFPKYSVEQYNEKNKEKEEEMKDIKEIQQLMKESDEKERLRWQEPKERLSINDIVMKLDEIMKDIHK